MKVNGIIAEYNPFHNGHKYQLEQAKAATGADYTICVMSGPFTQRGTPALLDKFSRARMALENGADLVIELPVCFATASAEYFAEAGVAMLDCLGVVDSLSFGSEAGDLAALSEIAGILSEEPEIYREELQLQLRRGCSYPSARNLALEKYAPALAGRSDVLSSPNNILGIEYLKALIARKSSITPYTTKRIGADYHDRILGGMQCSAAAIREAVRAGQTPEFLRTQMPESAYNTMLSELEKGRPVDVDEFSSALYYKLLMEANVGYSRYLDVTPDFSDRIKGHLEQFESFSSFCNLLKSKNMTYSRISRCMLHILLDITDSEMQERRVQDMITYARILGMRKDAAPLLTEISAHTHIPLVTSLADAQKSLYPDALRMLERDVRRSSIYYASVAFRNHKAAQNEFRTPIVTV